MARTMTKLGALLTLGLTLSGRCSAQSSGSRNATTNGYITHFGTKTVTAFANGFTYPPDSTVLPGGSEKTIDGTVVSLNTRGDLIVGSTTTNIDPQVTIGRFTDVPVNPTGFVVYTDFGTPATVRPGASTTTILGTAVALDTSGNLVIGTSTTNINAAAGPTFAPPPLSASETASSISPSGSPSSTASSGFALSTTPSGSASSAIRSGSATSMPAPSSTPRFSSASMTTPLVVPPGLSTFSPTAPITIQTTSIASVSGNTEVPVTGKDHHTTLVPYLHGCWFCPALGGLLLLGLAGAGPGVYPPPVPPPFPGFPPIIIGADGIPTPEPSQRPSASNNQPSSNSATKTSSSSSSTSSSSPVSKILPTQKGDDDFFELETDGGLIAEVNQLLLGIQKGPSSIPSSFSTQTTASVSSTATPTGQVKCNDQTRPAGAPSASDLVTALTKQNQIATICAAKFDGSGDSTHMTFNHGLLTILLQRGSPTEAITACTPGLNAIIDTCIKGSGVYGGTYTAGDQFFNITNIAFPNNPLIPGGDQGASSIASSTAPPLSSTAPSPSSTATPTPTSSAAPSDPPSPPAQPCEDDCTAIIPQLSIYPNDKICTGDDNKLFIDQGHSSDPNQNADWFRISSHNNCFLTMAKSASHKGFPDQYCFLKSALIDYVNQNAMGCYFGDGFNRMSGAQPPESSLSGSGEVCLSNFANYQKCGMTDL